MKIDVFLKICQKTLACFDWRWRMIHLAPKNWMSCLRVHRLILNRLDVNSNFKCGSVNMGSRCCCIKSFPCAWIWTILSSKSTNRFDLFTRLLNLCLKICTFSNLNHYKKSSQRSVGWRRNWRCALHFFYMRTNFTEVMGLGLFINFRISGLESIVKTATRKSFVFWSFSFFALKTPVECATLKKACSGTAQHAANLRSGALRTGGQSPTLFPLRSDSFL